jgi:hypothetical protein
MPDPALIRAQAVALRNLIGTLTGMGLGNGPDEFADLLDGAEGYAVVLEAAAVLAETSSRLGMALVVSQAIATLQAGMAAKVAELNAYYDDGHDLLAPNAKAYYPYLPDPKFLHSYPAIVLFPWPSNATAHHIGNEYAIARHFVVDVVEKGRDAEDLSLKLQRWELAIFELLAGEDTLPCGQCDYQTTDWNQPRLTERKSGDLLQDLPLLFAATTYETP